MKYRKYKKPFLTRRLERKSKRNLFLTLIITIGLLYVLIVWFLPNFIGSLSLLNKFKSTSTAETKSFEKIILAPPVLNIPFESTNTATIKIRGYASPNTNIEISLDGEVKSQTKTDDSGSFLSDHFILKLGRNNISGKSLDDNGNISLSSKPIYIYYSNEKPILELNSPSDNQTITGGDKKVMVSGKTNTDKEIVININGIMAIVSSDGNFSQNININEGENTITITAADKTGNTTTESRKVIYQPS